MIRRSLALFALVAAAAQSQSADALLPFSGFIYDAQTRSLRAVAGFPGSAYAGISVVSGVDGAWPSGTGSAVAIRDGAAIVVTGLRTSEPREHVSPGLIVPERVVWNSRGTFAALYSRETGSVQRVAVSTSVSAETALQTVFASPVTAMAIDDSGDIALGAGESIYLIRGSAMSEVASGLARVAALAFGKGALYAAHGNGITELRMADASVVARREVIEGRAMAGIAIQGKAGRVFAIETGVSGVLVCEPDGTAREIGLDRNPAGIEVLQQDSILLLNGIEGPRLPAIVLDIANDPVPFFVPVGDQDRG